VLVHEGGVPLRARVFIVGFIAVGLMSLTSQSATALTVRHNIYTGGATIGWSCPGHDPQETFTTVTRETLFLQDGQRVRAVEHTHWRGWITNRETGELVRDDGDWNTTLFFRGRHVVRAVTTGAVWRFTVHGHGIVVHQTGRYVSEQGEDDWATPFGGFADFSALCAYV
jgi:hypothetical protein